MAELNFDPPWIMHVYGAWLAGHTMFVVTPDGHLMEALHITVDKWQTKFTVTGVSSITNRCKTHTFDEYDEVIYLGIQDDA